ncbi:MAG: hypothetical protein ABIN35_00085 [candidate division WOR-3 bacterium]
MSETPAAEIVEKISIKTNTDTPQDYGKVIMQIRKSRDKISKDINLQCLEELVIRNVEELIAVRAIREKKMKEKNSKTQKVMSKFRKLI